MKSVSKIYMMKLLNRFKEEKCSNSNFVLQMSIYGRNSD